MAILSVGNQALNLFHSVCVVRPWQALVALLSVCPAASAPVAGRSTPVRSPSFPAPGDNPRAPELQQFIHSMDRCMVALQNVDYPPSVKIMHCAGDSAYMQATGHTVHDKGQHLLRVQQRLPPLGSAARASIDRVSRAMHLDVEYPVVETPAELLQRAKVEILKTPLAATLVQEAAAGILRDCNVRGQVDQWLFIASDVRHLVETDACAMPHRRLLHPDALRDHIANDYFLGLKVRDVTTAKRAMALLHHNPDTIADVNRVLDERVEDAVVAGSGI